MAFHPMMLAYGTAGVVCAGYVVYSLVTNRRKTNRQSTGAGQVTTVLFPREEFTAVADCFGGLYERLFRAVAEDGDVNGCVDTWRRSVDLIQGRYRLKAYFGAAGDPSFARRLLADIGSAGMRRDGRKSIRLGETLPPGYTLDEDGRFEPGTVAEVKRPAWFLKSDGVETVVEKGELSI